MKKHNKYSCFGKFKNNDRGCKVCHVSVECYEKRNDMNEEFTI